MTVHKLFSGARAPVLEYLNRTAMVKTDLISARDGDPEARQLSHVRAHSRRKIEWTGDRRLSRRPRACREMYGRATLSQVKDSQAAQVDKIEFCRCPLRVIFVKAFTGHDF